MFQTNNSDFRRYHNTFIGPFRAIGHIYLDRGIRGLFQGHSATLIRIFPYGSIKFVAYEQFRSILVPTAREEVGWRRFTAGSLAGLTSVLLTYPLEVIRVRLAWETNNRERLTFTSITRNIYHERARPASSSTTTAVAPSGIYNFYRGFAPTVAGMLPYAGVSFLVHDMMGDLLRSPSFAPYTLLSSSSTTSQRSRARKPLKSWAELTAGGVAGLVAQTMSYPLETVRRRMQIGGAIGRGEIIGFWDTVTKIWNTRGPRGFFLGLTIGYVKITPMVATSFFVSIFRHLRCSNVTIGL